MTYEFEWNVFASLGHLVAGAAASVAVLLLVPPSSVPLSPRIAECTCTVYGSLIA